MSQELDLSHLSPEKQPTGDKVKQPTAVPTMHQAILAQAERYAEQRPSHRLRFIRSSSASLPPTVLHKLEDYFQVTVFEAYGMTEAAYQMTSNPLPPLPRKVGSVGLAAGPLVAIMAEEEERFLPTGEIGEVVIAGENVTAGYLADEAANAKSFVDGWFRTGDRGYLDEDGYLFLTGRLKEILNRGGEKVMPRQVDEVLLTHPAVAQAVTFAVPHATLGEDVAAVVLKAAATEQALRQFAFRFLALVQDPTQ